MEFTTRLGLHSQTTRLGEGASWNRADPTNGALTLSGSPFQGNWSDPAIEDASLDYNSEAEGPRFTRWALPGSLAVTRGILVSFFSSA